MSTTPSPLIPLIPSHRSPTAPLPPAGATARRDRARSGALRPLKSLGAAAAIGAVGVLGALGTVATAQAATAPVTITVENLAAANGTVVAPLNFGFHSGSYDAFDAGAVAGAGIQRVAELGSGSVYLAEFAAADPSATLGTVGGGPLMPGATDSLGVSVDTTVNPYFSFAAMVVPSNDFFLGNDSSTAYRVFDTNGHLALTEITITARMLWDAGTEVWDPAAAAFVGDAPQRDDQHSVVAHNFAEFAAFNGLPTAAGYTFQSNMTADTPVYRISFASPVPEPETQALLLAGLAAMGWLARRRSARPAA